MKTTLIEMVQRILEAVDGQVVDSIHDTREAEQVANCIKETYEHLLYTRDIKARTNIIQLFSKSDVTSPTTFIINDNIAQIDLFKYYDAKNERYVDLVWLEPEAFINKTLSVDPRKENVITCKDSASGVIYNVYTDRAPRYYTSFDDKTFVCDAFDSSVEDTLMESKTVVYGIVLPEFKIEDDFVPDLAPQHFSLLLAEAKVQAGYELNKVIDSLERDRAMKQKVTADKHSQRVRGLETTLWKHRIRTGRRC